MRMSKSIVAVAAAVMMLLMSIEAFWQRRLIFTAQLPIIIGEQ